MILLSGVFDTSFGQVVTGMMRAEYNVKFPCTFDLFHSAERVAGIVAESVVLDNSSIVMNMRGTIDPAFRRISFTLKERIDKSLIEGRLDACLLHQRP